MAILQYVLLHVVPFILVLGVVITIHELGHFLAAKALGTKIDRFSIGMGSAIAQWRDKHGVEWRLGWAPIGGYVRFAGDENAASIPDADDLETMRRDLIDQGRGAEITRYFHFKPIWERAVIVAAGPVSNFILAITIFAALLLALGQPIGSTRIDRVIPGSPAEQAGFKAGDEVLSANGHKVESFREITNYVILSSDTPITFEIKRGTERVTLVGTPRRGVIKDQLGHPQKLGQLGLEQLPPKPGQALVRRVSVPEAIVGGTERAYGTITTTLTYIGRLLTGRENADQLAGPLGMAQLAGDLAQKTADVSPDIPTFLLNLLITNLELIGIISVGVGFMNLLPVPVLDGGHLLFYGYEAVTRRPLAAKVQAAGYRVGLALVLGLMLFATWNDLQRLRVFNLFGRLFS
ncbi:MAG TPA: M50 family metallopeptidase [Phenylobacterium sp.]